MGIFIQELNLNLFCREKKYFLLVIRQHASIRKIRTDLTGQTKNLASDLPVIQEGCSVACLKFFY